MSYSKDHLSSKDYWSIIYKYLPTCERLYTFKLASVETKSGQR